MRNTEFAWGGNSLSQAHRDNGVPQALCKNC